MNRFQIGLFFLWLAIIVQTAEMAYQSQSQSSTSTKKKDHEQSGYSKSKKPMTNQELLETFKQPINVGRDRKYDDFSHNDPYLCARDCCRYPRSRICYYEIYIEQYGVMGPACRNCSSGNMTDCRRQQCITANGLERAMMSCNRMLPGPTIYTCPGDRVIVDVINQMPSASITIHWHGVTQRETPFMDGVPYVSQCPIAPNSKFRYDFFAEAGTRFWHSHIGELQRDGVLGAIVARLCYDKNSHLYDYDLPSHIIQVSDWNYYPGSNTWPGYYKNKTFTPIKPDSFLINGVGEYEDAVTKTNVPLAEFHVKCGYRYRLRIIANTWSSCGYKFAIQDHEMTVIALDGNPVRPFKANTLFMGSGQRTDVVIHANQECGKSYYVVVKGANLCEEYIPVQKAYLVYDNCPPKPTGTPPNFTAIYNRQPYFNFLDSRSDPSLDIIGEDDCRTHKKAPKKIAERKFDYTFFLSAGSTRMTYNELFETGTYEEFYLPVGEFNGTNYGGIRDNLANVSNVLPPVPVMTQTDYPLPEDLFCDGKGGCPNNQEACRCCNVLNIKLNSSVRFIFTDLVSSYIERLLHPMHIHGTDFYILKQGTVQELQASPNDYWKDTGKATHLAYRDTILVPSNGYAVVAYMADNPGYWLMHCHMENHMNGGMLLIVKHGEVGDWKYPPKDWPKCAPYTPPVEGLEEYAGCADG